MRSNCFFVDDTPQLDALRRDSESRIVNEAKDYKQKLDTLQETDKTSKHRIEELETLLSHTREVNQDVRHKSEDANRKLEDSLGEIDRLKNNVALLEVSS